MTQLTRPTAQAVGSLLLVIILCSRVVAAQDGATAAASQCEGLAPGASWICRGFFGVIEWFIDNLQAIVRGIFESVVEFILNTPAPYADGERALLQRPDNGPWPALYDLYLTRILPIGLGVWALLVLLVQFTRLFTAGVRSTYQRARLTRRAAFALLFLIAWWPVGAFALHLADALTLTIAPSGEQIVGTVTEFLANIGGGLLVTLLVYLSAGVVAFLLVALFLARYVILFSFMPLMPLVIALGIIDEGPFKPIASVANSIGSLYIPFVFMTLPSAAILLVGYTIQDALRESLASISVLASNQPGATTAYALILFLFWVLALLAPIFVIIGGRGVYPLAFLGAGFIAGQSLSSLRQSTGQIGRRGGMSTGGESAAAEATTATSGALPEGQASSVSDQPALMPPSGTGTQTLPASGGPDGSTLSRRGISSDQQPLGAAPSSGLSENEVSTRLTDWSDIEQQLSENRRYEFGYINQGEFRPVSQGTPNTTKERILSGRIREMADVSTFEGEKEMYLRDDQGEYYDLTPVYREVKNKIDIETHGRRTVRKARQYEPDEATTGPGGGSE